MSKIRSTGTKSELLLGKAMWSLGLRYRKHYNLPGKPDFVFLGKKVAVFCDGDFWHGRDFRERLARGHFKKNKQYWTNKIKGNINRDKKNNKILKDMGWQVIRVWESKILKNPLACAKKVYKEVKS